MAPTESRSTPAVGADYGPAYFGHDPSHTGYALGDHLGGYWPHMWEPRIAALLTDVPIVPPATVLDFGCGAGYVVRRFRELGFLAYGLDVSAYAIENADPSAQPFLYDRHHRDTTDYPDGHFDLVWAKDVLEHVPPDDLHRVVEELRRIGKRLFVCVPVAVSDGGAYADPTAELDHTHVIRLTQHSWCELLATRSRPVRHLPAVCAAFKGERSSGNLAVVV